MAVTDWQVWLHVLLAWSVGGPRTSPSLPFRFWPGIDKLVQFTGSHSSYRRSSEGSVIQLPFLTFSLSLHTSSPVSSIGGSSAHRTESDGLRVAPSDCLIAVCSLFGQAEVALAVPFCRPSLLRRRLQYQHFQRLQRCKVLWHFLVRCWAVFFYPRYRRVVRRSFGRLSPVWFDVFFQARWKRCWPVQKSRRPGSPNRHRKFSWYPGIQHLQDAGCSRIQAWT